jgi:photosystem II stability/assembly factor-like uncharacterized protein
MELIYKSTKISLIMIFMAVIQFGTLAQSAWNIVTPFPTNNSLNALFFIDGANGWFAGSGDCILRTTDGGNTWTKQSTNTGKSWWGVHFADSQNGWIADTWGSISATTDGGNTWHQQAAPSSLYFYAMQFPDAQHGFVLLQSDSLFYTTNAGTTWNRIKIDVTQYHYGMKFVSPGEGWICGSAGQILHSTNGGIDWTAQNSGTSIDLSTIDFTDNQNGWAAGYTSEGQSIVVHTSNGGSTWATLVPSFNDKLIKIIFNDNNNGYAIATSGQIYLTTNGGTTWTSTYTSPHESLWDIQVLPSGTGYVCGTNGAILKTLNSGALWSPIYKTASNGYIIRDLSFPDLKNGWVLDDALMLMHTADSCNSWSDQTPYPSDFYAGAIDFSDASRGWVAGKSSDGVYGQILRTTDGGASFSCQLSTGAYPFISLSFSDSMHGIAGTVNRMIYHTSNGGATWDSTTVPAAVAYMQAKKIQMVDNVTGYAILSAVDNTALAKTTNGGQTWTVIKTDNTQFTAAYTDLSFIDAQNGYIAAFSFTGTPNKFSILKTTDGGTSFTPVSFPSGLPGNIGTTQINALHFSDMQHGWAAGGGTESFILYTDDGGSTWGTQELGTTVSWYTMQFSDTQTGYAAGWDGDIVRTTNGGLGINEAHTPGINKLVMYPNPARESVVIIDPFQDTEKAEIKVFDMTGRQMYSGSFTASRFNLDLSSFSNGIYFIAVSSGTRTLTNKLVVAR